MTNLVISEELHSSKLTITKHIANVFQKLKVKCRDLLTRMINDRKKPYFQPTLTLGLLGERLKEIRKAMGMLQSDVAKHLDVNQNAISRIENGVGGGQ